MHIHTMKQTVLPAFGGEGDLFLLPPLFAFFTTLKVSVMRPRLGVISKIKNSW